MHGIDLALIGGTGLYRLPGFEQVERHAVDTPYGPYADGFSEVQHKYGPFGPIEIEDRRLRSEQSKSK